MGQLAKKNNGPVFSKLSMPVDLFSQDNDSLVSLLCQYQMERLGKLQLCKSLPSCLKFVPGHSTSGTFQHNFGFLFVSLTPCFCVLYFHGHVVGQVKQSSEHFLLDVWADAAAAKEMINTFLTSSSHLLKHPDPWKALLFPQVCLFSFDVVDFFLKSDHIFK